MAYTDTTNIVLHMPIPGTNEPAAISLLNENCVQLDAHDHLGGRGLGVGRLRSGLSAAQPAAGSPGGVYYATDTELLYVDTGTTWAALHGDTGAGTPSATLIDPIIRDELQFGPQNSGVVDASFLRTGAGTLNLQGSTRPCLTISTAGQLAKSHYGQPTVGQDAVVGFNLWYDGTNWNRDDPASGGSLLQMLGGTSAMYTVGAGANPATTLTQRWGLTVGGAMVLTPDATQPALVIGAAPASGWQRSAIQIGLSGAVTSDRATSAMFVNSNTRYDGANNYAMQTGAASFISMSGGGISWWTAPSVAGGAVQTFTARVALTQTGGVTINADTGTTALVIGGAGALRSYPVQATSMEITSPNNLIVSPTGTAFIPGSDGGVYCGGASNRWQTVYAVTGTISTSTVEAKEAFAPLDPAACAAAVLETDWVSFAYLPPVYTAPEPTAETAYDTSDDNATKAEKKALRDAAEAESKAAHAKMLVETQASRRQKGYVLQSPAHKTAGLFGLEDRQSASPGSDLAVVACALQHALTRITALEAANAPAS